MRYLVVGGAGFIGAHLCERLLADGHEVIALDDLSAGSPANLSRAEEHPGFRFVRGDARDPGLVSAEVVRCDGVFHLAAVVGVRRVVEQTVDTLLTNGPAAATVLLAAASANKPVLLTSSSEVYGVSTKVPFREDDAPVFGAPSCSRWAYGAGKLLDEALALGLWRERGTPVVVARLFNTVGPRQSGAHGMVLPRFVAQARAGAPLTVYGDGSQTRCFCHVRDVVDALVGLLCSERARGGVFNVGDDVEVSIRALAERVVAQAGSASRIESVPFEQAFPSGFAETSRRVPCLDLIRDAIGWRPRRGLARAIDDLLADPPALQP